MSEFQELIGRAREGDEHAASELVAQFSDQVERVAKTRLTNDAIRRRVDETDVCQSVFAIFFEGLREGKYEVETPEAARNLLCQMARNRALKHLERNRAGKRDALRHADMGEGYEPAADQTTASFALMRRELSDRFQALLGEEQWGIVEARKAGRSWNELAREFSTTPAALRMRHQRAVTAAARALGIDPPPVD